MENRAGNWRWSVRICCLLSLFCMSGSFVQADAATLEPTKDSWLSENNSSSNYGSNSYLLFGNPSSTGDCNLILQYDVNSIPSGVTVTDVSLLFHKSSGSETLHGSLRRNVTSWSESSVTYGNYSPGILVGSITINGSYTYPVADASALISTVQGWIDGSYSNYGIMVEAAVGTTSTLTFYSREGSGNPIRLLVEYSLAGSPDLVVENMAVSNTTPTAGQSFTASAVVRNQGSAPSESTTLRYYRSNNATISTNDTELSTDGVSSLDPGDTDSESDSVSIATAGAYWIGACVDPVSGEANTSNNCSSGIQVVVGGASQPDLVATDITFSDPTPSVGDTVTIGGVISNVGDAPSGDFDWELIYDSVTIDSGRTNVAAGGQVSASISANVTINDTNQHQVELLVDTGSEVDESDEGNNSKTETITASSSDCTAEFHDLNDNQPPPGWTMEIIQNGELSGGAMWGIPTDGGVRMMKDVDLASGGVSELTAEWEGDLQYCYWAGINIIRFTMVDSSTYTILAGYSDYPPVGTTSWDTNFVRFDYPDGTRDTYPLPAEYGNYHYNLRAINGEIRFMSERLSDGTVKFDITQPISGFLLSDIVNVQYTVFATTDSSIWMDNLSLELCTGGSGETIFTDDFESSDTSAWSGTSP